MIQNTEFPDEFQFVYVENDFDEPLSESVLITPKNNLVSVLKRSYDTKIFDNSILNAQNMDIGKQIESAMSTSVNIIPSKKSDSDEIKQDIQLSTSVIMGKLQLIENLIEYVSTKMISEETLEKTIGNITKLTSKIQIQNLENRIQELEKENASLKRELESNKLDDIIELNRHIRKKEPVPFNPDRQFTKPKGLSMFRDFGRN